MTFVRICAFLRKNGARLAQNIRWLGRTELLEVVVAINALHRLEKGGEARCRIFFVVASSRNTGFEGGESQAHFFTEAMKKKLGRSSFFFAGEKYLDAGPLYCVLLNCPKWQKKNLWDI